MSALVFEYRAVDRQGAPKRGSTRAASEVDAYRQIAASGLTPLSIRAARQPVERGGRRRVRLREITHFTHQMAVLLEARIPVAEGLRGLAEQEPWGRFRHVLSDVAARIEAGSRIADALAAHEEVFGSVYVQTLRAAEHSGNLIKVLEYLGEMLERSLDARQQVRAALTYPACVVVVLVLAVVFLVGFVVPRFGTMYRQRGIDLPVFTDLLVRIGESMQHYWWAYALGAAGVVIAGRRIAHHRWGRAAFDTLLHRLPVVRDLLVGLAVARFVRVLGLCISSGIGLLDALDMAGKSSGRPRMQAEAERVAREVRAGGRLSSAMRACTYLPGFARRMLAAGEEAGELPRMCTVVARHHERDNALRARDMSTVIEPVLIVTIAGIVLVVALAVFMPMWDMMKLVG